MSSQSAVSPAMGTPQLETSDRKPRTMGLIVLLVTFGIFGLWAGFAPLDSASHAQGVVAVKGKRKTIQHLEGGIVREILVTDGQLVKVNEPLLVLDDTQFKSELGIIRGQFYAYKARESRLIAERDDLEKVTFPADLSVDDDRAKEAMRNEVQIFEARAAARLGEIAVLEKRIAQLESQINGLRALISSQEELAESYQDELKDLSALLSEGYVEKTRMVEIQRSFARTRGEIAEHQASLVQAEVRIGETRLEILQLKKKFKTEVVDALAEAQTGVYEIGERITAIQYKVERSVIRAPERGVVLGLSAHTVGGVIQPGMPILDIVPENQQLIIETQVSTADIDKVGPGSEAEVRFSAFKSKTTPIVLGIVTKVSADRFVDENTGAPYYSATVEVGDKELEALHGLALVPGMPAEVLIKTGERTLLQYLTQPAKDAMARSLIEE